MTDSMELGKKAENLIKEMMEELGFIVVRYGYEHLLSEFADRNKLLQGPAGEVVRSQPDFFIVDPKTRKSFFIEVKYRTSGIIDGFQLPFNWPESYVILVTPKEINIAEMNYILENPEHSGCFKYLTEIGPFRYKNKDIIVKYVNKAKSLFS